MNKWREILEFLEMTQSWAWLVIIFQVLSLFEYICMISKAKVGPLSWG